MVLGMLTALIIGGLATAQVVRIWLYGDIFASLRNFIEVKDVPFFSKHLSCDLCLSVSVGALMALPLTLASTSTLIEFGLVYVPLALATGIAGWGFNVLTKAQERFDDAGQNTGVDNEQPRQEES